MPSTIAGRAAALLVLILEERLKEQEAEGVEMPGGDGAGRAGARILIAAELAKEASLDELASLAGPRGFSASLLGITLPGLGCRPRSRLHHQPDAPRSELLIGHSFEIPGSMP